MKRRPSALLVVGGGVAGWTAARRAQQLGIEVTLVEKSDEPSGAGNARFSGGYFHAAYQEPSERPDLLFTRILAATDGTARRDVAQAWASNVGRAFRFLASEGGAFAPLHENATPLESNVLQPVKYGTTLGRDWRGGGPDRLLRRLHHTFVAAGGTFLGESRATELVYERGVVAGAIVARNRGNERILADAVVLADGGFQADAGLVARYITPSYKLRGGTGDTGDAMRMAVDIGAALHEPGMSRFYGHTLIKDVLADDRLWPVPSPQYLVAAGAVVDARGLRFVDEGVTDEHTANEIAHSVSPAGCWAIFDEATWQSVGRTGSIAANPGFLTEQTSIVQAHSLDELARVTGLPARTLTDTVSSFNRAALEGASVDPARTGAPRPIRESPFHALPLIAGITFTMGGVLVDGRAAVLSEDGSAIPGLFAAGNTIGGLQGGPRTGYAGGWSEAATFGLLAAESAGVARGPS